MSKKKNLALREAQTALTKPTKRKKSVQRSKTPSLKQSASSPVRRTKDAEAKKANVAGAKEKAPKISSLQNELKKQQKVAPKNIQKNSTISEKLGNQCKSESPTKKNLKRRKILITLAILATVLVLAGIGGTIYLVQKNNFEKYRAEQTMILEDAKGQLAELFQDEALEIPVRSVTEEQVRAVEERFDEITFEEYLNEKDEQKAKARSLYDFIEVREELDGKFEEGILKSATTAEEIDELSQKSQKLPEGYRKVLQAAFDEIQSQYQKIEDLQAAVMGLFTDESLSTVRGDIARGNYDEAMTKYNELLQFDVKEKWREKLEQVDKELGIREEEARRRAEEAWRKAEEARRIAAEERRRQEAEVAAAWHVLDVPYYSQNRQAIYNGCETASLLMGLQYKGYLAGMDLRTYAEMIPKSDDPFQGFTYSIWDLEPKHAAHWIAPPPLAQFGRDTSGANVVDITGASLDQLDAEIAAGNPVIIYLTFNYVAPKEWVEGAPRNLHVVLLTGYNSITGAQLITDPWTQANGATTWTLSKATVESIFNATGQRAVVIR